MNDEQGRFCFNIIWAVRSRNRPCFSYAGSEAAGFASSEAGASEDVEASDLAASALAEAVFFLPVVEPEAEEEPEAPVAVSFLPSGVAPAMGFCSRVRRWAGVREASREPSSTRS